MQHQCLIPSLMVGCSQSLKSLLEKFCHSHHAVFLYVTDWMFGRLLLQFTSTRSLYVPYLPTVMTLGRSKSAYLSSMCVAATAIYSSSILSSLGWAGVQFYVPELNLVCSWWAQKDFVRVALHWNLPSSELALTLQFSCR